MDQELYGDYYNGFSNSTLWPLFHYFPSLTEYKKEHFDAYFKVNRIFSKRMDEIIQPGDVIWVHDYQLMILPQMLRKNHPDATIGFFLHIPFPTYEILKSIPAAWRNPILESLTRADVVGFHTKEYLSHFRKSLTYFLNLVPEKDIVYTGGHN